SSGAHAGTVASAPDDAGSGALVDPDDRTSRFRRRHVDAADPRTGDALSADPVAVGAVAAHAGTARPGLGDLRVDSPDSRRIRTALANDRAVGSSGLAPRKHSCCNPKRDRATSRERRATRGDYLGLGFLCRALPTCFAIHATPHPQIRPPVAGIVRPPSACAL